MTSFARNRTNLTCQPLEDRCTPAGLDLTSAGASGTLNGAIFEQAAGSGATDPFLRVRSGGTEQGYNTDARPLQFDAQGNLDVTHALALADVPVVERNGITYREFVLDINQKKNDPQISLDQLQIFVGTGPKLTGYNQGNDKLAGQTAVYDMDAGQNNWVKLDARRGNTDGDMRLLVPDSAFAGANYVYLFSHFGDRFDANGGAEEWGVRHVTAPPPSSGVGSISGTVFFDFDDGTGAGGNGVLDPNTMEHGVVWTVFLDSNGNNLMDAGEVSVQSDSTGHYAFNNLPAGPGIGYSVRVHNPDLFEQTTIDPPMIFLTAGEAKTGIDFGLTPTGS